MQVSYINYLTFETTPYLRDAGRDFEAEVEDLLLALEADILGPPDHAREVASGLDVLANAEVARALLDERVLQKN